MEEKSQERYPGRKAVSARDVGKCYLIYDRPQDRLKQSLWRGRKKFHREFWALREVSFDIYRGETVGIVGSNGSGKSTLLQLICSILNPTVGELEIHGKVAALLELGAGFNPEFTGEENIRINAAIMGLTRDQVEESMSRIIDFADIGQFMKQPVKFYSSGMYVRLAFAAAVHVSPDILIVDEALAVGDIRFQQKCMAKIRDFCRTGTVIFVSHDTVAVTELCTRAIWIEEGRIRMDDRPKRVVEKYLEHMYGDSGKNPQGAERSGLSQGMGDLGGFSFIDESISQFGNGNATIKAVKMASCGCANGVLHAGEPTDLNVVFQTHDKITRPIVGYIVKDRLGRIILGENTEMIGQPAPSLEPGIDYLATFSIESWPNIPGGDYLLSIAVGDGTMEDHVQCHWLHDVVVLKNFHSRTPVGIFSVPGTTVTLHPLKGNP